MTTRFAAGLLLCAMLGWSRGGGGDPNEAKFERLPKESLECLEGTWEAPIKTKSGWRGTVQATVTLEPVIKDAPRVHAAVTVKYRLARTINRVEENTASQNQVVLLPLRKDKDNYLHYLGVAEFLLLVVQDDILKKAPEKAEDKKKLEESRPSKKNTVPFAVEGDTWTLDRGAVPLLAQSLLGSKIDWDSKLVFKKVNAKK
jgi:hypothetical protein